MRVKNIKIVSRIGFVSLLSLVAFLAPSRQAYSTICYDDPVCANSCQILCNNIWDPHEYFRCISGCQASCTTCY